MKKNGKYRFTLQFPADTDERIRVGELLEKLGNRKSLIIIAAVCEYLNAHPELHTQYGKIKICLTSAFDPARIEQLVRSLIEEHLSTHQMPGTQTMNEMQESAMVLQEDIVQMLGNLDMFG